MHFNPKKQKTNLKNSININLNSNTSSNNNFTTFKIDDCDEINNQNNNINIIVTI